MTHVFKVIVEKLDRDHLPHDISKQEGDNDLASRDFLTPIAQRLHSILGFEGNMLMSPPHLTLAKPKTWFEKHSLHTIDITLQEFI
jgi:hypothetical protein